MLCLTSETGSRDDKTVRLSLTYQRFTYHQQIQHNAGSSTNISTMVVQVLRRESGQRPIVCSIP